MPVAFLYEFIGRGSQGNLKPEILIGDDIGVRASICRHVPAREIEIENEAQCAKVMHKSYLR